MPCYCSEIPRCKSDIEKLRGMIATLNVLKVKHAGIENQFLNLAEDEGLDISPENLGELMLLESEENEEIASEINVILEMCGAELLKLIAKLTSMQISDRSYHRQASGG